MHGHSGYARLCDRYAAVKHFALLCFALRVCVHACVRVFLCVCVCVWVGGVYMHACVSTCVLPRMCHCEGVDGRAIARDRMMGTDRHSRKSGLIERKVWAVKQCDIYIVMLHSNVTSLPKSLTVFLIWFI